MASLDQWLAFGRVDLEAIYQQELGRGAFSDPEAFVNWAYHRFEQGQSLDWIRDRIRESPEWQQRHGSGGPTSPDAPSAPPVPSAPPMIGTRRIIPVTTQADGPFHRRFYSYWSNAWIDGATAVVFAGHMDGRPRFFRVHLHTGHVDQLGTLIGYSGTTEGWYWDRQGRLYVLDGPRLRRIHPFGGLDEILIDNAAQPGTQLWQPHSSDDGQVHSATVEQRVEHGPYLRIGTVVAHRGARQYFAATEALDESAVDTTGRYLLIKETRMRDKPRLDNRIIDFETESDRWLLDEDGAVGHSDMGAGFVVGEDDQIGACVRMSLASFAERQSLFSTWNMGHVSVRGGRCLRSDGQQIALVDLHGAGLTPLLHHDSPEPTGANLDPTGQIACYMVNGQIFLLVL